MQLDGTTRQETLIGPMRVFPGWLSVSRTIGDIEAKFEKFGGNPRVVISDVEIQVHEITAEDDFILLGCDGIFDWLSNREVIDICWKKFWEKK